MSPTYPTLETDRLILRVPVQADFDAGWAELHGDAQSMRWLGGAMLRSIAWRSLAQVVGSWGLRGFGPFSVIEKASGRWVGRVGPWEPEGWPAPEVGWMLHRSAEGQGYATEAAQACLTFVFQDQGWTRVTHMIHPENLGSQAVARRLGGRLLEEVRLPAPFDDHPTGMWGQTAADWAADAAGRMKARLRIDLKAAMRDRATGQVRGLRALIAALDNAEAVPAQARHDRYVVHAFGDGSAEVPRRVLTAQAVEDVLRGEAAARRADAADLSALGKVVEADALLAEAVLIDGYLEF
ncbi:GNAT family N-acetyltransferase [Phenylobacterium aquaticum]|uniref:GNAT family N-acetyltransferase n=1 Tax=Phenylobacterium aquaticum TaxID=1763816 RepID=UPI0034CF2013